MLPRRHRTARDGYNMGRKYFIKANTQESCEQVERELSTLIEQAKKRADTRTWFEKSQASVKQLYDSPIYLTTISALLIVVINVPRARARPPPCKRGRRLSVTDPFLRGRRSCCRA